MKKYSLIYILLVTLFFTSCNDFLKETNYSGLSDEPFYDSEVGIEALVNSCYTPSRLWYGKEGGTSYNEDIDQRYTGTFREVIYNNGSTDNAYTSQEGDTAIYFTKKSMTKAFADRVRTKYCFKDIDSLYYADGRLKDNRWFIEMHKHADHTRSEAFERSSRRDAFVIRLSEMYLIAAEAEMLNNNMPMAVKYMNDLRIKRAYPGHEEEMKVSANDMNIDFILDERARELVGEQLRWFDLKRTGKLVEYVKRWNPDAKDNIKDYHILRPIPQTQLDAISNKTDFLQNAGYN